MTIDELHEEIQSHFDYLDALETDRAMEEYTKNPKVIYDPVMDFDQLDRDLYFVHDLVCCGVGSWINNHMNNQGWVEDAIRAFKGIGHIKASEDIIRAKALYADNVDRINELSTMDFLPFSEYIFDNQDQIYRDLRKHLLRNHFIFRE